MLTKGLLLLFVGLKLAGLIGWSWFVVLLPGLWLLALWIYRSILNESLKRRMPWAIKLVAWVKS
ncbi:MAG: hypothetical protein KAS32_30920 [Candidatus Peribacteraceae bacterium]|nr:hypothetical protein [Candidatus Peribacteraceae bacterium]